MASGRRARWAERSSCCAGAAPCSTTRSVSPSLKYAASSSSVISTSGSLTSWRTLAAERWSCSATRLTSCASERSHGGSVTATTGPLPSAWPRQARSLSALKLVAGGVRPSC